MVTEESGVAARPQIRISGLDSVRFIAAAIVMLGHIGLLPPDFFGSQPTDLERLVRGGSKAFFNGPAAVIVFFVLSGFVIHFPYAQGKKLDIGSFYTRRFIRIGIPASAAVFVYLLAGVDISYPLFGVLWSIICEAIYYALYPGLKAASEKLGWSRLGAGTFLLALVVGVLNAGTLAEGYNSYPALGLWTWVIGLPCWVMGCWLAENWKRFPALTPVKMWMIRLSIYVVSVALALVKSQVEPPYGSYVFTLNFFALAVAIWLGLEVAYFRCREPFTMLESAGVWSYSLYLAHPVSDRLFTGEFSTISGQLIVIIMALLSSFAFYRLVERPSHRLAIAAGRWLESSARLARQQS